MWMLSLGRRVPWSRKWQPLQYSCLKNSMDRRTWWAIVHGVAKNWTGLTAPMHGCMVSKVSCSVQFSLLSHVGLFATPRTGTCQVSLSIVNSQSLLKLMSIELVMPSNHLILCPPCLLLPSTFPSIRVFLKESVLYIRWPKYWNFSFNINPCI